MLGFSFTLEAITLAKAILTAKENALVRKVWTDIYQIWDLKGTPEVILLLKFVIRVMPGI